jgi:hypothetical protein
MQMPPGSARLSGGDVDTVAVDLLAVDHHVTEVDADAEFHPALAWGTRVLRLEGGLDLDRTLDCVDNAGELRQYAVARRIDESSLVLLDQ